MSAAWPNLRNYAALQLLWLAAVAGAGRGLWWPALVALALFATLHFGLHWHARGDATLMLVALGLGAIVDSTMAVTGLAHYAAPVPFGFVAPVWILALWMALGLTLQHSFAWLMRRPVWAVVVMAIGGPLSYLAAERGFHAVAFDRPLLPAMLTLGALWGIATGLLAWTMRCLPADPPAQDAA